MVCYALSSLQGHNAQAKQRTENKDIQVPIKRENLKKPKDKTSQNLTPTTSKNLKLFQLNPERTPKKTCLNLWSKPYKTLSQNLTKPAIKPIEARAKLEKLSILSSQ